MTSKNTKEESKLQRIAIAAELTRGSSIRATAAKIGCSTRTVQKVQQTMRDPNEDVETDRRENNGREAHFTEETKAAILAMRTKTGFGPRLMWAMIMREPERWGIIDHKQIPSVDAISKWVADAGLTRKMIGAKDKRGFPIDFENAPGVIAIDEHGPIHYRASNIFLVTFADRFTKLSAGIPIQKKGSINSWTQAYYLAKEKMLDGKVPTALWVDNGVGMCFANGWTTQPVRHALMNGTRVVFNVPHQPWRNGRLENWHYRQQAEYWDLIDQKQTSLPDAIKGFLSWINFYNIDRAHGGIIDSDGTKISFLPGSKRPPAPADLAPWYEPLTGEDFEPKDYEHLDPQAGIVDMIRMVENNGKIQLQDGEVMKISEVFGGQYVRVRFHLKPGAEQQIGEVIWQRGQKKEALTVATFNHDVDRKRVRNRPLVTMVMGVDFDEEALEGAPIESQRLNEFQARKKAARIGKKTLRVEPAEDGYIFSNGQKIDKETGEIIS